MALESLIRTADRRLRVLEYLVELLYELEKSRENSPFAEVFQGALTSAGLSVHDPTEDKIFRHCAVITRAYALFEKHVEGSVAYWLSKVPFYRSFQNCDKSFKNSYRIGIARLLQDIEKHRYKHLQLLDVVKSYSVALLGRDWEVVPEALVARESNLRKSEIEAMFGAVGIPNCWAFFEKHPAVSPFLEIGLGANLEDILDQFIILRNEASHGSPDELLGVDVLKAWVSLIRAFCTAVNDLIYSQIASEEKRCGRLNVIGVVTESLSKGICVVTCGRGMIRKDEGLFLLQPSTTFGYSLRINSLQLDGIDKERITVAEEGVEIGMQTNCKAKKGWLLVRLEGAPLTRLSF